MGVRRSTYSPDTSRVPVSTNPSRRSAGVTACVTLPSHCHSRSSRDPGPSNPAGVSSWPAPCRPVKYHRRSRTIAPPTCPLPSHHELTFREANDVCRRSSRSLVLLASQPGWMVHTSPRPEVRLPPERSTLLATTPVLPPYSAAAPRPAMWTCSTQLWLTRSCGSWNKGSVMFVPSTNRPLLRWLPPNATSAATPGARLMRRETSREVGRLNSRS